MKIQKLLPLILLSIVIISCKKEKEQVAETIKNDSISLKHSDSLLVPEDSAVFEIPKMETFGFPSEVQGCSCYFAQNKSDFENQKYVYVDDYGNNAFIQQNGKLVEIQMEEGDFDPENFEKTIENTNYKVYMKGKNVDKSGEVMMFQGQMIITNKKTGEEILTPIYGECGC